MPKKQIKKIKIPTLWTSLCFLRSSVLMLCAPSNGRRPFLYHTIFVFYPFSRETVGINSETCIEYDSQIDKPQRGRPKRAELPDVKINMGAQSINTESLFKTNTPLKCLMNFINEKCVLFSIYSTVIAYAYANIN